MKIKELSEMGIKELREMLYIAYQKTGHEYMWDLEDLKLMMETIRNKKWCKLYFEGNQFKQLLTIADIAEVGLINTEVSELLEDIRKGKDNDILGLECADIIIRVMNYCTRKGINLESYMITKHHVNMRREKLHGGIV